MANFETPDMPEPKALPKYFVGAASPLWAYFGTAAAGGVAFWWMTRWAQAANLEAMFGQTVKLVAEPVVEVAADLLPEPAPSVAEVAPDLAAASDAPVEAVVEPEPIAEPEPVLEAAPEPIIEAAPEPVIEAIPEPVVEAAPEPVIEAAPEPVVEAAPEPVIEAEPAPEPVLEAAPAPKPRAKKAAPAPATSDEA